jgi:hypothetical protein
MAEEWSDKKFDKWQKLREKYRTAKSEKDFVKVISISKEIIALDKNAKFIGIMIPLFQKDIANDPMAVSMLATMNKANAGKERAAEQVSEGRPLAEVAVENASKELLAKLPQGSRITLIDTSQVKTSQLSSVIGGIFDNLSAAGKSKGITIIERGDQKIIAFERQYQASGEVSDETAVSIGNELGLTTIVFCSIEGETHQRRLRVRAVDVETSEVIYTESFEI